MKPQLLQLKKNYVIIIDNNLPMIIVRGINLNNDDTIFYEQGDAAQAIIDLASYPSKYSTEDTILLFLESAGVISVPVSNELTT